MTIITQRPVLIMIFCCGPLTRGHVGFGVIERCWHSVTCEKCVLVIGIGVFIAELLQKRGWKPENPVENHPKPCPWKTTLPAGQGELTFFRGPHCFGPWESLGARNPLQFLYCDPMQPEMTRWVKIRL